MIFVDTTVWVGDADLNDDFHESSHSLIESIRKGQSPSGLVTDFILDEAVTILGKRRGFGAGRARDIANAILASPRVFTVFVEEGILKEALSTYPMFGGRLSLTDVVSVVVMRRFGVKNIFSHDSDFDSVKDLRRLTTV